MYEKILQKLKAQREKTSTVSDRSLEDLAKALVPVITTEEALALIDLAPAIKSIDGNINHYTKTQLEKIKADEKAAQEAEAKKAKEKAEGDKTGETTPDLAKLIADALAPLATEIASLKKEKVVGSRLEKLQESLKGLPEFYTKPLMAGFNKVNFESDADFDTYLQEVATQGAAFTQAAKEHGLPTYVPGGDIKRPVENGETESLASAREILKKANEVKK